MTDVPEVIAALREHFLSGATKPHGWRISQLRALRLMITENHAQFEAALRADLGKHAAETVITETGLVLGEIDYALRRMRRWMRPRRVRLPLVLAPARGRIFREPRGVILIIGPWNYPLQLVLAPLVGALAAGNTAIIKPSELASATSSVLADLLPRYLDPRAVAVIEGGSESTTALLQHRLDHILFTGSERVGSIVATAAAQTMAPVTLELGGKSPVYVDDTVDPATSARRIMWGKLLNAGQTCVAPDYLLATRETARALLPHLERAAQEMYGSDPVTSDDYGRTISREHTERLAQLLEGQHPVFGGTVSTALRYVAPTVIDGVDPHSRLMQEEIFGPILPIVHVASAREAIDFVRARPKPLALYVFSHNKSVRRAFLTQTSSGSLSFGVPAAHLSAPALPFGGVGASGNGAYHGEHSFLTFSHSKSVLDKPLRPDSAALAYPPYNRRRTALLLALLRRRR